VRIKVIRGPLNIFAPNVFTPNGDNINDAFTLFSGRLVSEIIIMRIYDRWGNLVFEKNNFPPNDVSSGWDGRNRGNSAGEGVFVWYAFVKLIDNSTEKISGEVMALPNK
jgi:gliding motility-associated-like protein